MAESVVGVHRRARGGKRRSGKTRAILAGCAVLGVGAAVTLAAWTDNEWVFGGGTGAGDPIGTSSFNIQQNVFDGVGFTDRGTTPGGQLRFSPNAGTMTPGSIIAAPMQLRTAAVSDPATVTMHAPTLNGSSTTLFAAVTYAVYTGLPQAQCTAAHDYSTVLPAAVLVAPGSALTVAGAHTFGLLLNATSTEDLCFVISLPANASNTLQGQAIGPAWDFTADSV